ncbi:MAG: hypothetical protein WCD89_05535 [Anaerocolumna sp.]
MAKIGKIRIVNFTYNDNRHIYDQTLDLYKGENTLLNLQNGGGKTVLVQMMMQPIVPKQKLKDRLFKNYFTNAKAPCYILIEWELDGKKEKLLTGIGIKRIVSKNIEDESDSLKIITFLSEYEGESDFDINKLELLEEEKGIVKLIEYDKVIRNLSEGEKNGNKVWLFRWDLPDDKKEYTRRLLDYKINPIEWKNLMVKINESEAGLNSFFNDCKTTNALIKKWFIPTIEEQLNKNGNFIDNIKELIQNHALQLVKNEAMIKEREVYDRFRVKAAGLYENLETYEKLLIKAEENKSELGNAYLYAGEQIKVLNRKKEEILDLIKQREEDKKALEYEKKSGEYHEVAGNLWQLKEKVKSIDLEIERFKRDLDELEYKKKVTLSIRLKEELTELGVRIAKFEMELEKENLEQEDRKGIITDLLFSLKEKYGERVLQLEEQLDQENQRLTEEKNSLSGNLNQYEKIKSDLHSLQEEILALRSRIAVFQEREKELRSAYPEFLSAEGIINTAGRQTDYKGRLDMEEQEIGDKLLEFAKNQKSDLEEAGQLEKELQKRKERSQILAIEKNRLQAIGQAFDQEKKAVEKILTAYQLTDIFDKEKILERLHGDLEKYNKLIGDRNLDNSLLSKQMKLYESGKAFELPEGFLKKLEDSDIFFEHGYEWIRSQEDNKREKQKLVKNNPFLPYSLIVAKEDMARIRNIEFEGTIPVILPILEKEKLEEILAAKTGKNVYSLGTADFLISFDDRILNKNYLIEILEEIKAKVNKNYEILEKAQGALRNTELGIIKVEGFSYTREYVEKLEQDSRAIDSEAKTNEGDTGNLQEKIRKLSERIAESYKIGNGLESIKSGFQRKKEDILGFLGRYEGYSRDLGEMEQKEADKEALEAAIKDLELETDRAKEKVQEKAQLIMNIATALDKDRNNYEKYRDAESGNRMEEDIGPLESRLRVLTSDSNGKIQNLQEILEDYRSRRREKGKELLALQIEEQDYTGQEYHEYELETVEKGLEETNQKLIRLTEEKNGLQFTIAEKQSDLKYAASNIKEQYGYEEPMPKDAVRKMDFAGEREKILAIQKKLEKELSQVKIQDTALQKAMFSLEEYGIYAASKSEVPFKEEGNLQEQIVGLIKSFKEYGVRISDAKNTLSAAYLVLETEFTDKNEMFKSLFHSILDGEKKYQPVHAKNAFNRVNLQIERKLEQHSIDLKKIDDMERCIIDNTISYLMNFYDELNSIDRNSAIDINGRKCKMLLIELPEKEALETIAVKEYLKETIRKCENLYRQGKTTDSLLLNEISTYYLFDRLAGISKIHINLMKIEPNRLKKKAWKQVIEENSGGEKFVSAFVVFISLMTYMRGENLLSEDTESKVLIMDNPFGPITSEHLLKPLFEIAKKYNTQMICLSDLKEHTIFDRFNLIYSLNIEREVGREEEYIELKTIKKDVQEQEDEILSASMFKIEDRTRFERVN